MEINIPGKGNIKIKNLLLDYNGTIACDGQLMPSVKERVEAIHEMGIAVYVLTSDTNGTVENQCAGMPVEVKIFDHENAAVDKRKIVEDLGAEYCLSIGNGLNDGQMFAASTLSIVVIGDEGCSAKSLMEADVVCKSIEDAFDLILKPNRMIATLRS